MSYEQGDTARVTNTFTDATGAVADPTTVSFEYEDPSGNTTTVTYAGGGVTKSGTGVYYVDLTFDESGVWNYKWTGTGTVAQSDEGSFFVLLSDF